MTGKDCSREPQPEFQVKSGGQCFNLEQVTTQLEHAQSKMLADVLTNASSYSERLQMLDAIKGINAMHRLQNPDANVPLLLVDNRAAHGWSDRVISVDRVVGMRHENVFEADERYGGSVHWFKVHEK